jgi:alpha-glucosidase
VGDLNGITEKLPYVAKLGAEAVWLSPFAQSPQKDFGYDVSDYTKIDPRFGTMADFKKLVKRAHALGLKLIMDQVWCHCSDQHAWFKESRADKKNNWFIWAEAKADGAPPNNWLSYFGGSAWTWDAGRRQYYFHQFLPSQPTFNLRHKRVRKNLLNVGKFWLERGVDGFRLDAIHTGFADPHLRDNPPRPAGMPVAPDVPENIPQARQIRKFSEGHKDTLVFLEEIRAVADRYGAYLLGEVSGENPYARAALYTQGKRLHAAYSFGLLKARPTAKLFRETVVYGAARKKRGSLCYALSNHDVMRVASRWAAEIRSQKLEVAKDVAKVALLFGFFTVLAAVPLAFALVEGLVSVHLPT